jgi:hypothetical protein
VSPGGGRVSSQWVVCIVFLLLGVWTEVCGVLCFSEVLVAFRRRTSLAETFKGLILIPKDIVALDGVLF